MLFHLAHPFVRGACSGREGTGATYRPSRDGNYGHFTLKLTFPRNPNGVYLLKGGGPDVCRTFAVPRCWRKPQGVIHGKHCGVTEKHWGGCASRLRERREDNGSTLETN